MTVGAARVADAPSPKQAEVSGTWKRLPQDELGRFRDVLAGTMAQPQVQEVVTTLPGIPLPGTPGCDRLVGAGRPRRDVPRPEDALDSLVRHSAQLAPPLASSGASTRAAVEPRTLASLEEVLPALVKKIAWSGDARRGTLRIEFGAGEMAGATLLVHADDGRVRVELQTPRPIGSADATSWRDRIAARLRGRGLVVDSVDVS